jgi:hypothetical protein
MMVKGQLTWAKASKVLAGLQDSDAEGVRLLIVNYLNSVIASAKTDEVAGNAIALLTNFLPGPYNASNKLGELYRDLAFVIWPN